MNDDVVVCTSDVYVEQNLMRIRCFQVPNKISKKEQHAFVLNKTLRNNHMRYSVIPSGE